MRASREVTRGPSVRERSSRTPNQARSTFRTSAQASQHNHVGTRLAPRYGILAGRRSEASPRENEPDEEDNVWLLATVFREVHLVVPVLPV